MSPLFFEIFNNDSKFSIFFLAFEAFFASYAFFFKLCTFLLSFSLVGLWDGALCVKHREEFEDKFNSECVDEILPTVVENSLFELSTTASFTPIVTSKVWFSKEVCWDASLSLETAEVDGSDSEIQISSVGQTLFFLLKNKKY